MKTDPDGIACRDSFWPYMKPVNEIHRPSNGHVHEFVAEINISDMTRIFCPEIGKEIETFFQGLQNKKKNSLIEIFLPASATM